MARGIEGNEIATPRPPPKGKTGSSSAMQSSKGGKQSSIAGFFQKRSAAQADSVTPAKRSLDHGLPNTLKPAKSTADLTPAPSSGAIASSSPPVAPSPSQDSSIADGRNKENETPGTTYSSPSRKAKKQVSYVESDAEDDEDDVKPASGNRRASKRRRISVKDDSEDEYGFDAATQAAMEDDDGMLTSQRLVARSPYQSRTVTGIHSTSVKSELRPSAHSDAWKSDIADFVIADDDEDVQPSKAKKRLGKSASTSSQSTVKPPSPPSLAIEESEEIPTVSTAQQWNFDPDAPPSTEPRKPRPQKQVSSGPPKKGKAHQTEPAQRHTWLANILDADRNPPGHPDFDPRTLYIPPVSLAALSDFEQQYWGIKKNYMNTIVFFKKGKFYELYENDATIGHQLFDFKLTDRVNMRMVGVPEASLDHWANQFVAKGYKIARVDQMESALAKDMREREDTSNSKKPDKIIRRELASVLTSGTLVDGAMLQDDMATYCAAIKEVERNGRPCFGIAFVDTATAQFHLANIEDDPDMTRFETFVAQTRPGELLLEKSCISVKALRILKNNTGPTTIWNYLKSDKEFLSAEKARMKIDGEGYFDKAVEDSVDAWPTVLREAKEKDLTFSALGALVWYLSTLKIERDLITCGNFAWYDPIRKASSLVLDGQSLINLEIFANTFDGSTNGTLFTMLNRCITAFGKRMLRQWVCHPLADARKINQRLDAVEALNADGTVMDRFTASLSRLPDLERLISRVHAGRCKPQDFVKVLDGFEQIEYTMSLLGSFGAGDGVLGQLISSMPDLASVLHPWKDTFDRARAKEDGIFVPQPGVEEEYDESQERIDDVEKELQKVLNKSRKDLGSSAVKFTDNGKEIYQLEVPIKVKGIIPKTWKQMSATKAVKRWYSPELEKLVQSLKEAQEMHAVVVKALNGRFYARFDADYCTWLDSTKIVAQLDCLIALAKASSTIGSPACRPEFVEDDDARSVLEFKELRHPCVETTTNFIPNDIALGGEDPSMTLLTGANAAGKSTILRMTCTAVILAQIGCYVPCESARLTPVDRIMSRLGAHDNIFAGQSTFMVELTETKKILSEATPRSLVILDELGRGTSSYDGVAVAQAVLHHIATHVGALGYFATHYHSLAAEFASHPEIAAKRMAVRVEHDIRDVTFLYKLEKGVAEGSYGMHCAAMCGIPGKIIDRAEQAAQSWEHTGRMQESVEKARESNRLPLGVLSDVAWMLSGSRLDEEVSTVSERSLEVLRRAIAVL
ncbi:DNA mismatch repair protein msh6 [Friedmanniomyces endolithicus]|uniref:DNA mismatch repair protein n=1 Tax=Friedmanniomyces endolithicus TaxID=329885 RepID=A0AAN6J4S8_9PEZI|nr:DNA mismatch repair protein msh6 [Friedmanniomyces endolithicus]KAK0289298.1 DNA mismatch repair protein msh6 [Friedmanniomyces endolithicus]KAK0315264.1 DNA mismatch repair protein msh6 [Friedmanniomyces endolithicus]KAK0988176.1 DNA mismatch repair protein msh6 [Friedmanniomyces endolithicus]